MAAPIPRKQAAHSAVHRSAVTRAASRRGDADAPGGADGHRAMWTPRDGRAWPVLARLVTLALVVACLAIIRGPHVVGDYATETDFYGAYANGARLIQQGRFDPSRYSVVGPVYELALALAGRLAGELFLGAQLLSTLAAAVTLLAWERLLRARIGAMAAAAATLLIAADPSFLRYGYSATTDALAMALQALALALMFTRRDRPLLALAGVAAGLAILTRYTAVVLVPAAVLAAWSGNDHRRARLAALGAIAGGMAAPLAAWVAVLAAHRMSPGFAMYQMIAFEAFARARGITWDEYQRTIQPAIHSPGDVLRYDPPALAHQLVRNLWRHAWRDATELLATGVAAAAALGAALSLGDGRARRMWPLAASGAASYLAVVPVTYSQRYSLPLIPYYAAAAALALGAVAAERRAWTALRVAALTALVVLAVRESIALQVRELGTLPLDARVAADTLRAHRLGGDAVIARKPHLAYLAGVTSVPFPDNTTFSELIRAARAGHARWLFVSSAEAMSHPANLPLLDTTGAIPGLTPRCVTADPPSVLYELGPGLGQTPAWAGDAELMALRLARARIRLGSRDSDDIWVAALGEIGRGRWADAHETLRQGARLDPRAGPLLAAVDRRDSSRAVGELLRLLE